MHTFDGAGGRDGGVDCRRGHVVEEEIVVCHGREGSRLVVLETEHEHKVVDGTSQRQRTALTLLLTIFKGRGNCGLTTSATRLHRL